MITYTRAMNLARASESGQGCENFIEESMLYCRFLRKLNVDNTEFDCLCVVHQLYGWPCCMSQYWATSGGIRFLGGIFDHYCR